MKRALLLITFILLGLKSYSGNNKSLVEITNFENFNSINLNFLNYQSRFNQDEIHPGVVLIVSGVGFFTAGYLTGKTPYGLSGPRYWPWHKQYGRAAAMVTGGVLFAGGITYTISF